MRFVTGLLLEDVGTNHRLFQQALEESMRVDRLYGTPESGTTRAIRVAYGDWQLSLERIAKNTVRVARRAILAELTKTRRRPDTGVGPHLRDLIRCVSLDEYGVPTGSVGIADIDRLDKAINPLYPGAGSYWRAQEYGYDATGRRVVGGFFGPGMGGGPFAPDPGYTGRRGAPHPIFASNKALGASYGAAGFGGPGGLRRMTIHTSIKPRHFIRNGAALAEVEWRTAIQASTDATLMELRSALAVGAARPRRR